MPSLSLHSLIIGEGDAGGFPEVLVTLDRPATGAVTVSFETFNLSASSADYLPQTGQISFAAGQLRQTIRIALVDDTNAEVLQSFGVRLLAPINATLGQGEALVTIRDNDGGAGPPLVSVGDVVVDEAAGIARLFVMLDRPSGTAVSVDYATQAGSAAAGADFTSISGRLTFAPGELVKVVEVALADDASREASEQFALRLSAPSGAVLVDGLALVTIADNDAPASPMPLVSLESAVAGEGDGFVAAVVRLDAPSAAPVSVTLAGPGIGAQLLTFAPGEVLKLVQLPIADDALASGMQGQLVQITGVSGATIGNGLAWLAAADNDLPSGTPLVALADVLVDEAAREAVVTLRLDRPATAPVSFTATTADGTARAGQDYAAVSTTIGFAPGAMVAMLRVPLLDDAVDEGAEQFELHLSQISGASAPDTASTVTIASSDGPNAAEPLVWVEDAMAGEWDGFAQLVVRLSQPAASPVSLQLDTATGSAGPGDFAGLFTTLTFAPGEVVKLVRVPLQGDVLVEGDESFTVELEAVAGAQLGRGQALVLIADDDAPAGVPQLAVIGSAVDEGAGEAVFTLRLDRPSLAPVVLTYASESGSAVAGADFTAVAGNLLFAPGELGKQVRVALVNDAAAEGDEYFRLRLSAVSGASVAEPAAVAVIVRNDAAVVTVPLASLHLVVADEAAGFVELAVHLSAPSAAATALRIETLAASAGEGDFTGLSTLLRFAPGQTLQTLRVPLIADLQAEAAESFVVELVSAVGLVVTGPVAVAIIDDDTFAPPAGPVQTGSAGAEWLAGTAFADELAGLAGDDLLFGLGGADRLDGGAGADILLGGSGADVLSGGAGVDVFRGTLAELAGETITDFAPGDRLHLTDAVATSFSWTRNGAQLGIGGTTLFLPGSAGLALSVQASMLGGVELIAGARRNPADFTGDGRADILWRHASGGLTWWRADGNGFAGASGLAVPVDPSWQVADTADISGDGLADVLWRHANGGLTWWRGTGSGFDGGTGFFTTVSNDWQIAGLGDLSGDGRADILWRHAGGGLAFWVAGGNGFAASSYYAQVGIDWQIAAIDDFSGDGLADILWRHANGALAAWRGHGSGFDAAAFPVLQVDRQWQVAGSGDIDGDGMADILWRHSGGGLVAWRSTGSGFDGGAFPASRVDPAWQVAAVEDYDGDGRADIVWRHASGSLTWWRASDSGFDAATGYLAAVGTDWAIA